MAWPAKPQDNYGLEKLCTEQLCQSYGKDFGMDVRIARFHNIYGPNGTWKGGREKFPAAAIRKAITSFQNFEMWGDGKAMRSFMYVDDCVEGIMRLMDSDFEEPINLGSDRMISIKDFATMIMETVGNILPFKFIPGPQGVRGRNSDNTLIEKVLGWVPQITLEEGIARTTEWINKELLVFIKTNTEDVDLSTSNIVEQTTESLDNLSL
jgi:GDP-D-mannose 3',5'-epimerase